jgi:DNA modification methylase
LQNDTNDGWLKPAFAQAYRVFKLNRFCACFYSWPKADKFLEAWRSAGFRTVGHLVFLKSYTSKARFLQYCHEQAFLAGQRQSAFAGASDLRCAGDALHRQ